MVGDFQAGDLVRVLNDSHREVAIGLCRYSSAELEQVRGRKTAGVMEVLGNRPSFEVVHRDDMVVAGDEGTDDDQ